MACRMKLSPSLVVRDQMLWFCLVQLVEQFVARVTWVFDDPALLLAVPLGVEVLRGWQLRLTDMLSSFHHAVASPQPYG